MRTSLKSAVAVLALAVGCCGVAFGQDASAVRGEGAVGRTEVRSAESLYATQCASCHGADLNGGGASSLVDGDWQYGVGRSQVTRRIKFGIEDMGMPDYAPAMTDAEISSVVSYIFEEEKKRGVSEEQKQRTEVLKTADYRLRVETVVGRGELQGPWAIDWIRPDYALITERPGRLRVLEQGKLLKEPVAGIPLATEHGQGGLMDVAIDPEYETNGWIYLSYTNRGEKGYLTRIVRGKIADNKWTQEQVLFEPKPEWYSGAGVHFGSRIVFDKGVGDAGHLFFSIGDRGQQSQAQDVTRPNGKVHRIKRDGTIPADNPFVKQPNAVPSIFSFGNRNPQGLAIHPETGELWATEHGPMGGDELNWIRSGRNYGWPVITFGKNYNGTKITDITAKDGMEQPATQWTPSLAVCGLDFYRGEVFPKWKNQLLVGALAFQEVRRVQVDAEGKVLGQEVVLKNQGRVRDVTTGPDGAIWVVLNGPDRVVRLVPAE